MDPSSCRHLHFTGRIPRLFPCGTTCFAARRVGHGSRLGCAGDILEDCVPALRVGGSAPHASRNPVTSIDAGITYLRSMRSRNSGSWCARRAALRPSAASTAREDRLPGLSSASSSASSVPQSARPGPFRSSPSWSWSCGSRRGVADMLRGRLASARPDRSLSRLGGLGQRLVRERREHSRRGETLPRVAPPPAPFAGVAASGAAGAGTSLAARVRRSLRCLAFQAARGQRCDHHRWGAHQQPYATHITAPPSARAPAPRRA